MSRTVVPGAPGCPQTSSMMSASRSPSIFLMPGRSGRNTLTSGSRLKASPGRLDSSKSSLPAHHAIHHLLHDVIGLPFVAPRGTVPHAGHHLHHVHHGDALVHRPLGVFAHSVVHTLARAFAMRRIHH